MGPADRRWAVAMMTMRETNARFGAYKEWCGRPENADLVAENIPARAFTELDTFMRHGSRMAAEIDGWIHHRTNVHLPARKIGEWVNAGPEFAAFLEGSVAELEATRQPHSDGRSDEGSRNDS